MNDSLMHLFVPQEDRRCDVGDLVFKYHLCCSNTFGKEQMLDQKRHQHDTS